MPTGFQRATRGRPNLEQIDTEAPGYEQEATMPLKSETHAGEDVAVFAQGPGSDAVRGSLEQNALFHVIAQNDDAIRGELCKLGSCDANGVPVKRPERAALVAAQTKK